MSAVWFKEPVFRFLGSRASLRAALRSHVLLRYNPYDVSADFKGRGAVFRISPVGGSRLKADLRAYGRLFGSTSTVSDEAIPKRKPCITG